MKVPGFPFVQAAGDYADRDGMHYGFAIHATANTASDQAESSYASHREDGTSAHAYVDRDSLTQALDTERRAGHAGSAYGNEHAIAIEITGLNSWTRETWLANVAWDRLGEWLAYVIRHDPDYARFEVRWATVAELVANPKTRAFYTHDDMRRAWGGTDHTDPGPNFPKDRLILAVQTALAGSAPDEEDSMTDSFGPIEIPPAGGPTQIPLPPVEVGALGRPAWLNMTNDTYDQVYGLRLAVSNGTGGWAVRRITVQSGYHFSMPLPKGTTCVAISRQGLDESGNAVNPGDAEMVTPPYDGPLSVMIERGPVVR